MAFYQWTLAVTALLVVGSRAAYIEEKLQSNLFKGYKKHILPNRHVNEQLDFQFGLYLINIGEVKRDTEEILFNFWGKFQWVDYRLQWDPDRYDNVTVLRVPGDWLWKPDITSYGSSHNDDHFFMERAGVRGPLAILSSNGTVLYIPPIHLRARCHFEQHADGSFLCSLKFGSWTYSLELLKLSLYEHRDHIDLDYYHDEKWAITSTSVRNVNKYYPCCPEAYPYMEVNVTMKETSHRK